MRMAVEPPALNRSYSSEEERAAILEQLERLLANPHFSHSRRFPSFLRFVVERRLSGDSDVLKERTLGIEIFGRHADYDTASDPIVRVTAGEIRKRIAQYYQEPGHETELRIALPSGSYVPQFHWPGTLAADAPSASATGSGIEEHPEDGTAGGSRHPRLAMAAALLAAALLGVTVVLLWQHFQRPAPVVGFWTPVLSSSNPVLFCIADQSQYSSIALRDADDPDRQIVLRDNLTAIIIDDLGPVVRIAGILQSNGKKYSLRGEDATSLMDLRTGPTIFVGAFDNAWTLRLTRGLRYHFANSADMTEFRIVDSQNPGGHHWVVNRIEQMATNNYRDYAIVGRFTDVTTGELEIVVAGVGRGGTIAAGEFLTDPSYQAQLRRIVQAAGTKKNLEVVLSTQIINGESGTPRVEATYYW
jgi:hypothetical protein